MGSRFVYLAVASLLLVQLPTPAPLSSTAHAQGRGGQGPGRGAAPAPGQQGQGRRGNTPTFPGPPAGMQALPIDLFTSKNFYADKALWSDKRYFRCNTPRQITDIWTSRRIGANPPTSASWGDCSEDYPRDKVVSPYPHTTAKAHYDALMAQAKAAGGPTVYTRQTMPDWDGWYGRVAQDASSQWIWGTVNQTSTILSVLTPEYQKRMVQMNYHEGVDNAPQWEASFCYPEGYLRWWAQASGGGNFQLTVGPTQVQLISGVAANFLRQVLIGRSHVQKVPQWYGETVGFWNGTTLVAWTANVQGWTLSHSMFEFSDSLETIDVFTPRYDASGAFVGLSLETTFYDPEAFAVPLHNVMNFTRAARLDDPERRYTYIECLSNLRNVDGRPRQLTSTDPRYIDYYGRPWAQNWEKYFEVGWDKPNEELPAGVLDILDRLDGKKK
ncbi:MAG: hypothetical protein ABJA98_20915 [Acidobacteriota bacterium]